MQESLKKARVCPFCGSDHTDNWTWITHLEDGRFMLLHYCHTVEDSEKKWFTSISVYGNSPEACVQRWNANGKKQDGESL